ncbi:MAG: hypothetical protein HY720_31400 [Planctomycetes bacterium]|nr:hypothetical protein [Planctomycetota bacterium]
MAPRVSLVLSLAIPIVLAPNPARADDPVAARAIVLVEGETTRVYAVVTQGREYLSDAEIMLNGEPLVYGFPGDGSEGIDPVLPVYHADLTGSVASGDIVMFVARRGGQTIYERGDVRIPAAVRVLPVARSPWEPRIARARWEPAEGAEDYIVARAADAEEGIRVLALAGDVDLADAPRGTSFFLASTAGRLPAAAGEGEAPRSSGASRGEESLRLSPAGHETHGDIKYRMSVNDTNQITDAGSVVMTMKLDGGYSAAFVRVEKPEGGISWFWKEINFGSSKEYRLTFPVPRRAKISIGRYHADYRDPMYRK